MSDARIIIEIDYEPNLEHYPADIKTKLDAMELDVASERDGILSVMDLIDFAYTLDIRVEER